MSGARRTVITGMGVLTASGRELTGFWESLVEGRSASRRVTRFAADEMPTRVAAELDDFEPTRHVDAKTARRMDLCCLYGVAAAKSALEDAGIGVADLDPDRVGIAVGTSLGGIGSTFAASDGYRDRGYRGTGLAGLLYSHNGAGSAEIAVHLGVRGHALTLGSGSASSNDAIGYASDMITLDRADVMIAGGAEAPLLPVVWASMCLGKIMTRHNENPTQAMRPFDREHDGPLLGEGGAFIIMEELEHARARGARVYCEVLSHGRSSEAHHALAPHPDGNGPRAAMRDALRRARKSPDEVGYVNAHGTATLANDAAESRAIQQTFNGRSLPVSSTKPVTGHLLGAAGALETVITALAIFHQTAPLTLNFDSPAAGCELDYVRGSSRATQVKVALNLSCGFGGTNSCLVLGAT
ncbi:MAG TPA: beta-ketoacyl-[acyl-carrier-protein] synthase family protein [Polyangiaceae bacterium]|nr:beta-ketoacyl-[acyl-carrier-protein] synthase family protein [Polyangiaceae bacterium]